MLERMPVCAQLGIVNIIEHTMQACTTEATACIRYRHSKSGMECDSLADRRLAINIKLIYSTAMAMCIYSMFLNTIVTPVALLRCGLFCIAML